jgi:biopolymer transport protein ExbD
MVDVLLVLLCFFIVTWNFARKENELDVRLPKAEDAPEQQSYANQTVLNVKSDGTYWMNRKAVAESELEERLRGLAALYPEYAIILRGDERAAYGVVARAINLCKKAGISNIAFDYAKSE